MWWFDRLRNVERCEQTSRVQLAIEAAVGFEPALVSHRLQPVVASWQSIVDSRLLDPRLWPYDALRIGREAR